MRGSRWLCTLGLLCLLACGDDDPFKPEDKTLYTVPGDFATIRAAIDHAGDGDTILVAAGTYTEQGNSNLGVRGKAMALIGPSGPDSTVIEGAISFMEQEERGCLLKGFTITGSSGVYCAGVRITIEDCIIDRNGSYKGGGVLVAGSSATIRGCRISNNSSEYWGGGIYCEDSGVIVENCTIVSNSGLGGGGIALRDLTPDGPDDYLKVKNCTIVGNYIIYGVAGGVDVNGGSLDMEDCIVAGNKASLTGGGGISVEDCTARIMSTTIASNRADSYGAGLAVGSAARSTSAEVERCIIWNNCSPSGNNLWVGGGASVRLTCCAVDSTGFDVRGHLEIVGDQVWSDPLFHDPDPCGLSEEGDYSVSVNSPCTPDNSPCGDLIGAPVADTSKTHLGQRASQEAEP